MKKDAKAVDVERILKTLRSVGTGGALGCATGIGVYALMPSVRASGVSLEFAAGIGAAVGTALHRTVAPLLPCLNHYRQMAEIQTEVWLGLMPKELAERLRTELQLRYFLGAGRAGIRGSPVPNQGSHGPTGLTKQSGRLQRSV